MDQNGEYQGLSIEYLQILEELIGVEFNIISGNNWHQLISGTKYGYIDLISSVSVSHESHLYLNHTEPYISFPIVIFTKSNISYISDLSKLNGKKVAVVSGYAAHSWIQEDYPKLDLVPVRTAKEALNLLDDNKVFAVVENLVSGNYYISQLNLIDIKVAGNTPYTNIQTMGVRKDWPILLKIIQKALDSIPMNTHEKIHNSWQFISYEHSFNYSVIWKVLVALLVIVLVIIFWNRKLSWEVTERTKKLNATQEQYKKFIEVSTQGISRFDFRRALDTTLVLEEQVKWTYENLFISICNDVFAQMYGFESSKDLIGQPINMLWESKEVAFKVINRWIEAGFTSKNILKQVSTQNGQKKSFITNLISKRQGDKIVSVLASQVDFTEQIKLENKVRQSEKMDAIGNLAGGIAHDFNNILSGVFGFAELSLNNVEHDSDIYHNLNHIIKAAERAKNLVDQILNFSRQENDKKESIFLTEIVDEAIKLLRASLPSSINIIYKISVDKMPVLVNVTKIHEVLINLCTNAAYAMGESGTLEINHDEVYITKCITGILGDLQSGYYSVLSVKDTGLGISKDHLTKIFEPYFTTKKTRDGTGIGLSVVAKIITEYCGNIIVESEKGIGSKFIIYIPKTEVKIKKKLDVEVKKMGGSETVLFLDDEPSLLAVGIEVLRSLGYIVEGFTDPSKALNTLLNNPDKFSLIITDQTMPHKTGLDVAKELYKTNSDLPVLICSGNIQKLENVMVLHDNIKGIIKKPYLISELDSAIRTILS